MLESDSSLKIYTLSETASQLGINEEDLPPLLSDTVVASKDWQVMGFTHEDVALLAQRLRINREFDADGLYGAGDL